MTLACEPPHRHDLFFPTGEVQRLPDAKQREGVRSKWSAAVVLCAGCPIADSCLANELASMRQGAITFGVFAGTTPDERRAMIGPVPSRRGRRPGSDVHRCGSTGAYKRHRADGEEACAECKRAHALAKAMRREQRRALADVVLFPPPDWSVMRPLRSAALAASWALRGVVEEARTA